VCAVVTVIIASNGWADLVGLAWRDEESSHVLLVPFAAAWIAWVRRARLAQCHLRARWVGTVVVALGWFLWSFGYRYQIQSFWHGGSVLLAVGAVLTVLGLDVLVQFLPVFLVLIFLVPVPRTGRLVLALPLERLTAAITQQVAEVFGMTVQRHGNLLNVNGTDVAVVEACSGMRMVFTLWLACFLFAFVTPLRTYVRVLILALSPIIAVACNVIRLVPTIWVFGHFKQTTAESFHSAAGWFMLILAFCGLVCMVRVLKWAGLPVAPAATSEK
jgi:exosortase